MAARRVLLRLSEDWNADLDEDERSSFNGFIQGI